MLAELTGLGPALAWCGLLLHRRSAGAMVGGSWSEAGGLGQQSLNAGFWNQERAWARSASWPVSDRGCFRGYIRRAHETAWRPGPTRSGHATSLAAWEQRTRATLAKNVPDLAGRTPNIYFVSFIA